MVNRLWQLCLSNLLEWEKETENLSAKKRKIGQYYLKLGDKETEGKYYSGSAIVGLLDYILKLPKVDRKEKTIGQNQFYFLDSASSNPPIVNLVFKTAKTHHSPNLISEVTVEERPNPKELSEGDAEKTHLALKYTDNSENIILLFEERKTGLGIARAVNYLNRFAEGMSEDRSNKDMDVPIYNIEYYATASKQFIDSLAKFGKITVGRLIFDKSLLANQSEFLAATNREDSIKRDITLVIKSEKFETILPNFVKRYYTKHMLEENKIKRIRLDGKNIEGNPFTIDTEKLKDYEYVEVELDEKTGTVNSASIFDKLNTMIRHIS